MRKKGLSRIIATFDWEYKNAKAPEDKTKPYWYVEIGDWKMPWNLQLPAVKKNKKYAWAEIPESINEVGSTFTIQGADLNYAGVIIGPSVKYRNGRIITDKTASKSKKATNRRTLKNGEKKDFAEKFLNNELNVLLTRGVNGMYIYAVDDELRAALKKNVESKKIK
ncbi:DNA/RNA helicase domain-containing protein [Amylolactobacillus amylophilus]|uniref:DNA/RNA helicase domain-containing protein n=1 Tax=Amylolactobacillus amylophilus TaxID=1603 RepID=UPI000A98789B